MQKKRDIAQQEKESAEFLLKYFNEEYIESQKAILEQFIETSNRYRHENNYDLAAIEKTPQGYFSAPSAEAEEVA